LFIAAIGISVPHMLLARIDEVIE